MLRSYVLAPDTLRRILRVVFWRFQLIVTLSFLAFGLFLVWQGQAVHWSIVLPMVLVIALAYFFIIYFNFRQQMRLWYSIRFEIDGSSLIYRQVGQPPMRIMRSDITAIHERRDGLLIETNDPAISLLIIRGLARTGDVDIRETLNTWMPISPLKRSRHNTRIVTLLVAGVGGLLILLFANSLWLMLPLGLFLVAFGVYTERRLNKVHSAAPGVVQMYSVAYTFLIFVILVKSCFLAVSMLLLP